MSLIASTTLLTIMLIISSNAYCNLFQLDTESENATLNICQTNVSLLTPWEQYQCKYIQNRETRCWPQRRVSNCALGHLEGIIMLLYDRNAGCTNHFNQFALELQNNCWNVYQPVPLAATKQSQSYQSYVDYINNMVAIITDEVSIIKNYVLQANPAYQLDKLQVITGRLSFGKIMFSVGINKVNINIKTDSNSAYMELNNDALKLEKQTRETFTHFTLASYNTFGTDVLPDPGPSGNQEPTRQILEIARSGLDAICLQELFLPETLVTYQTKLRELEAYPYSFSQADIYDFDNLPRAPCSAQQVDIILSCTICSVISSFTAKPELLGGCLAIFCKPQLQELLYSECFACVGLCSGIDGCSTDSIQTTTAYCSQQLKKPIALLTGTAVFSKYPIVNQWHIEIPSWISKRAVVLTEIDISELTNSSNGASAGTDTIIFGCLHLQESDFKHSFLDFLPGSGLFLPITQEQVDLGISSQVELNAYQIQWILDNIFAADVAPWINDGDNYNVVQLFMAGDINVGDFNAPENLQIFTDNGWVNAREIEGMDPARIDNGGTWCADPHSDLPNILAYQSAVAHNFLMVDEDTDHILVYDGGSLPSYGLDAIRAISFKREFTKKYNVNGESLPLSDHWGISLTFDFVGTPYHTIDTRVLVLEVLIAAITILFVIQVGLICYQMIQKSASGRKRSQKYDYQFVHGK